MTHYDTYNCAKQSLLDNFFLITHNIFQKTLLFCKKNSLKKNSPFFYKFIQIYKLKKVHAIFFLNQNLIEL